MTLVHRALAVVVSVAAVGGCLLTSDFDGVAGTRPDGGPNDAGSDAAADASTGEGGAGTDAAAPCASGQHVFCTDFDDVTAPPIPGWTSNASGGTLRLDSSSAVSAPNSLVAKVKGSGGVAAYLLREGFVGATYQSATLSFDVRIIDCPAQVTNSLTLVYMGTGLNAAYGLLVLSAGDLSVGALVDNVDNFFPLERPVPKGTWTHLAITLSPKSTTVMHIHVTVDGQQAVDTDAPGNATKQTVTINVGAQGSAANVGCEVAYDNVVFDKQ